MKKIEFLESYMFNFFSCRFEHLKFLCKISYNDRQYDICRLKEGYKLMNFAVSIHDTIEEKFYFQNLIPHKFATPDTLLVALNTFKNYLNDNQKIIDINISGENSTYFVCEIQKIKTELIQAIDYINFVYDYEDLEAFYQRLKFELIMNNIPNFVAILKLILASVSYMLNKGHEIIFHTNVHVILKMLGFEIFSEELTINGRIDAAIRFSDKIFIIEFKFNRNDDLSNQALKQIKDNAYALKFASEKKDIYGIGISFSKKMRNINGFITEKIN